jgi:starvation-inducible DNA-binding protein
MERVMDTSNHVIRDLRHLLADTYVLYTETQYFHWNVTGELFFMLHEAFEKQYEELALAVDLLAERLRALNDFVPAILKQFQELSALPSSNNVPNAEGMIKTLLDGHAHIADELGGMIQTADKENDQATMDMMIERQTYHQKTAWMLRSCLSKPG